MTVKFVEFRPTGDHKWVDLAMCAQTGTYMYPAEHDRKGIELAKESCLFCPVRAQCLNEAMSRGDQFGIWGGMTPDERRELRRKNRARLSVEDTAALDGAA